MANAPVETVPADIPLHPDFEWSAPIDAKKFIPKKDPSGSLFSFVVYSDHKSMGEQMPYWDWYKTQLEANGWTNVSYAGAKTNIRAQKNDRYLLIMWDQFEYYTEEGIAVGKKWPSGGQYILYYR